MHKTTSQPAIVKPNKMAKNMMISTMDTKNSVKASTKSWPILSKRLCIDPISFQFRPKVGSMTGPGGK
uniref:Uncharacterized protein n=1 Tax=Porcine reproductive and respiratory syndrome virus 2 TaxID=1965067 RepID=A0A515EIY9_9NIDO|nr:hypothetical protein [Porcine reproductive and respiratory syndrome virus 2]QDL52624.1 hypothetical protein [Porcine reproductive and respiratory syndrome virus 2]